MTKKHYKDEENDPYNLGDISDFLYNRFAVTSTNECTGLIPNDPEDEFHRDNYKEIYDIN